MVEQRFDLPQQEQRFERLEAEWLVIRAAQARHASAVLEDWEGQLARLASEADELKADGAWWRGRDDMMGVLGYSRDEVRHCRVMAWLLDPLGTHGLGNRMVTALVRDVAAAAGRDPDVMLAGPAPRVRKEEVRDQASPETVEGRRSRADIVLYGAGWCVLIEAKIDDRERDHQLRALAKRWRADDPVRVWLTIAGEEPTMADPSEPWIPYAWARLGAHLEQALHETAGLRRAPGRSVAEEYLRSFRRHLA